MLGLIVENRKLSFMLQTPSTMFMDYINSLDQSVRNEIYKKNIYKELFINYASLMIMSPFKKKFINFIKQHQLTITVNSMFLSTYKELKKEIPESLKLTTNSELFLTNFSFEDISDILTNENIAIYKYLKFNKYLYDQITNQSLKVKTTFSEIYTNNPTMDLKNDFCRLLISKFGLPMPQQVSLDFLNSTIICENKKYKEELLKKAKTNLSFDQRFEWFTTTKITDEKLVNALFESDNAITIINAFKSAKLLKLSRKEALLGIKTISKKEVFNIQEINLS